MSCPGFISVFGNESAIFFLLSQAYFDLWSCSSRDSVTLLHPFFFFCLTSGEYLLKTNVHNRSFVFVCFLHNFIQERMRCLCSFLKISLSSVLSPQHYVCTWTHTISELGSLPNDLFMSLYDSSVEWYFRPHHCTKRHLVSWLRSSPTNQGRRFLMTSPLAATFPPKRVEATISFPGSSRSFSPKSENMWLSVFIYHVLFAFTALFRYIVKSSLHSSLVRRWDVLHFISLSRDPSRYTSHFTGNLSGPNTFLLLPYPPQIL